MDYKFGRGCSKTLIVVDLFHIAFELKIEIDNLKGQGKIGNINYLMWSLALMATRSSADIFPALSCTRLANSKLWFVYVYK